MAVPGYWTNKSVRLLADDQDPISVVTERARNIILGFLEAGGAGPPFDTMEIARFMGITVTPSVEVRDAQTTFVGGKPHVEFNPNRPKNRIRYSICHELVHTLFPDWKEETRHRAERKAMTPDGWQLEILCNIGAAEILMPIGSFPQLQAEELSVDKLVELASTYQVSVEALFLRFIRLSQTPAAIFGASRIQNSDRYRVDYSISSQSFSHSIPNGLLLPVDSVATECTAIGFTSRGCETWNQRLENLNVECIGIAPYPYQIYPRVIGLVWRDHPKPAQRKRPQVLKGDATQLRGKDNKILAFVVNDKTPRWGAGFALAVRNKWSGVQSDFVHWVEQHPNEFRLGNVYLTTIEPNLTAALLISQHGYGDAAKPRIRYQALYDCLNRLAAVAQERNATVHMPRIGSGQARGHWPIILEMIEDLLSRRGIDVTIYDLPHQSRAEHPQQGVLGFSANARG